MPRQDPVIEFYYSGAWHQVTAYGRDPVVVTRGKQDEGGGPTPATATFTLDNRDRRWSTFNPTSPLYGLVGQNTPVRITLTDYRFWGEVASMRPKRSPDFNPTTGRGDAWVEVEAAGPLRRINAGRDPLPSPLRRAILAAGPTAYWTLEDTSDATSAASAIAGQPPMTPRSYSRFTDPGGAAIPPAGLPRFATGSGIPGSLPVPDLAQGGGLGVDLTPPTAAAQWRIGFVLVLPRDHTGPVVPIEWTTTTGDYTRWRMQFDTSGLFLTVEKPSDGTAGYSASWSGPEFDGRPHYIEVEAFDVLNQLDVRVYVDDYQVDQLGTASAASLAGTVGYVTRIDLNPLDLRTGDADLDSMPQLGHIAVWQPYVSGLTTTATAMLGYAGESTMDRYGRLCGDQDVTATYSGPDAADVQSMGVQRVAPFADQLAEIERTEGGLIYESRGGAALVLVVGRSMHGAAPVATLDYTAGHLTTGSDGVLDDQGVRNDVTAKSTSTGATARRTLDAGPMSTAAPPDGVGRYESAVDVNPARDAYLGSYAGRALTAGTTRGLRFPRLVVDVATNTDVAAAVCALDPGDRVRVVNLPADVAPDALDLVVMGTVETIGTHTRTIEIIGRPYATVDAPVVGAGRADSTTSSLAAAVAAPAGSPYRWTFDAGIEAWSMLNGSATWDAAAGAVKGTPSGSAASVELRSPNRAGVTPGQTWAATWRAAVAVGRIVTPQLIWRNASGGLISSTAGTARALTANTPTDLAVSGVAPAGAAQVMLSLSMGGTPPASHVLTVYEARVGVAASLSVTRDAGSAKWTTNPAEFPFDARLDLANGTGGERVTVASISGTGTTQTFTVLRAINGVARSWDAGTRVRLWDSPPVGL